MTGFLAVDSNAGNEPGKVSEDYGKLRLLELTRGGTGHTVAGPGQASNDFVDDNTVSTQLNLLDKPNANGGKGTEVVKGNLLTLPVGGGILYVQPVCVRATGSSSAYPKLQYVLTSFDGSKRIGFAKTLDEALNQTFGGNSGVTVEKPGSGAAGQGDGTDAQPTPSGAAERLSAALTEAQSAMEASSQAMKNGDWKAYGEAQERLQKAIEQAVAAQQEIDGQ